MADSRQTRRPRRRGSKYSTSAAFPKNRATADRKLVIETERSSWVAIALGPCDEWPVSFVFDPHM